MYDKKTTPEFKTITVTAYLFRVTSAHCTTATEPTKMPNAGTPFIRDY